MMHSDSISLGTHKIGSAVIGNGKNRDPDFELALVGVDQSNISHKGVYSLKCHPLSQPTLRRFVYSEL